MTLCDVLTNRLKPLSASRVAHFLNYSFNAGLEEIEMDGVYSTPAKLMADLPGLHSVPAHEVAPLSFWGGPQGKRKWYDGSLLSMLVDHILRAYDAGNNKMLENFLSLYP
jgi:hypothetical protein